MIRAVFPMPSTPAPPATVAPDLSHQSEPAGRQDGEQLPVPACGLRAKRRSVASKQKSPILRFGKTKSRE